MYALPEEKHQLIRGETLGFTYTSTLPAMVAKPEVMT